VLGEEVPDQFTSAPHTDFLENRLEVVLHGVGRDVKHLGNFSRVPGRRGVGAGASRLWDQLPTAGTETHSFAHKQRAEQSPWVRK
jgi:hypothetical protein